MMKNVCERSRYLGLIVMLLVVNDSTDTPEWRKKIDVSITKTTEQFQEDTESLRCVRDTAESKMANGKIPESERSNIEAVCASGE